MGSGIFSPPIGQLTADGYDLQFGTNVLGIYFPFIDCCHLTILISILQDTSISRNSSSPHFSPLPSRLLEWVDVLSTPPQLCTTSRISISTHSKMDRQERRWAFSACITRANLYVISCHVDSYIFKTKFCCGFVDVLPRAMSCSLRRLRDATAIKESYRPRCTQVWIVFGIIKIQIHLPDA